MTVPGLGSQKLQRGYCMIREKHRYILVESGTELDGSGGKAFSDALCEELLGCIGALSYHKVKPKVVKMLDNRTFILKTSLYGCGMAIAALALIKEVGSAGTYFYTLKTSGTIRALVKNRDGGTTSKNMK